MPKRKLTKLGPSNNLADIDVGQLFKTIENGKSYILIDRDPWFVYAVRVFWFDKVIGNVVEWFSNLIG